MTSMAFNEANKDLQKSEGDQEMTSTPCPQCGNVTALLSGEDPIDAQYGVSGYVNYIYAGDKKGGYTFFFDAFLTPFL